MAHGEVVAHERWINDPQTRQTGQIERMLLSVSSHLRNVSLKLLNCDLNDRQQEFAQMTGLFCCDAVVGR